MFRPMQHYARRGQECTATGGRIQSEGSFILFTLLLFFPKAPLCGRTWKEEAADDRVCQAERGGKGEQRPPLQTARRTGEGEGAVRKTWPLRRLHPVSVTLSLTHSHGSWRTRPGHLKMLLFSFCSNMKLESAATSSVEDRVKRNIHSIQRTTASLEKNFMRRWGPQQERKGIWDRIFRELAYRFFLEIYHTAM